MKAWVECYARLLNVEFEWPSNELHEVPPTAGEEKVEMVTNDRDCFQLRCDPIRVGGV